jgi:hypothetical protein
MTWQDRGWRDLVGTHDALSGVALLAVGLFAWVAAASLPFGTLHQPGAGFLPKSLAAALVALALILWVRGAIATLPDAGNLWPDRAGILRVGVMCGTLMAYVLVVETAGYLVTTAGMFCVLLRRVGRRSWPTTLLIGLAAAAASYLVFARWLLVSLPTGTWVP